MPTAADIARQQAKQNALLPGTVVIERVTLTPDGMGGQQEAWAAAGTVIGRIYLDEGRGSLQEAVGGGQVQSTTLWIATFPVGTDVTARDRLFYGDSTWEVLRVNNDQMWQTAVRCELSKTNEERRT